LGVTLLAAPGRVSAGIEIGSTIITPVEDPHYQVVFDFVVQDNTRLEFGDTLTVGPFLYINPNTAVELERLLVPFRGIWAGKFTAALLQAPNANVVQFTYVGRSSFINNTGQPIPLGRDENGYQFGIFTIDLGETSTNPLLYSQLTARLSAVSVTSDPEFPEEKITTFSTSLPAFAVPEPSTLVMFAAVALPVALRVRKHRRSA